MLDANVDVNVDATDELYGESYICDVMLSAETKLRTNLDGRLPVYFCDYCK